MTVINPNTFNGPNQGLTGGYEPHTDIVSDSIDADFNQILVDLDNHLLLLQTAFEKLDQIDLQTLGGMTGSEIVAALAATNEKIPAANLDDLVVVASELAAAITAHQNATVVQEMQPETAIKSTELTYSGTPTGIVTTCNNLLDEITNIRYQIYRIVGKTTWIDTPDSSLAALKTSLDALIASFTSHSGDAASHLTANQNAALDAANSPSGANPFVTLNDIAAKGVGDMARVIYDTDQDGVVDKAEALAYGTGTKSFVDIVSTISNSVAAHANVSSAHHSRYTDAEAIGAINNDSDHSSTARHYYNDLLGKPASIPAASLTSGEVSNLKASKLANGTTPWTAKADLINGAIPGSQLQDVVNLANMGGTWREDTTYLLPSSNAFFSNSYGGEVSSTITGPALILGGIGFRTTDHGYLRVSVNGSGAVNCSVSPESVGGIYGTRSLRVWTCPQIYIPAGYSFRIIAGSDLYNGSIGSDYYGAGFHFHYRPL